MLKGLAVDKLAGRKRLRICQVHRVCMFPMQKVGGCAGLGVLGLRRQKPKAGRKDIVRPTLNSGLCKRKEKEQDLDSSIVTRIFCKLDVGNGSAGFQTACRAQWDISGGQNGICWSRTEVG